MMDRLEEDNGDSCEEMSQSVDDLQSKMDALLARVFSLEHKAPLPTPTLHSTLPGVAKQEVDTIRAVSSLLAKKVTALKKGKNPKHVEYTGLVFESPHDLKAWIHKTGFCVEDAVFIVDPHTVLEHVFGTVNKENF